MLTFLYGSPSEQGVRLRELLVLCRVALWCFVAGPALVSLVGCMAFHQGPIAGEPKGARFMQLDGARVRYTDEGEGPPVVLIHGFASSLDAWATVTPRLVKNPRVIALDLMATTRRGPKPSSCCSFSTDWASSALPSSRTPGARRSRSPSR